MDFSLQSLQVLALIPVGAAAGFVNTLAGSGSLITLPMLIFLGLPAPVANGTNRVGIVLQNIVATAAYQRQHALDSKGAFWLSLPAIAGALLGAQLAVDIDAETLERVIGGLMLAMLIVIAVRPNRFLQGDLLALRGRPRPIALLSLFAAGVYGGFVQAGVGIFLLAALVLGVGYDLVRANAVKVAIVLLFSVPALLVFVAHDQVQWAFGLVLGIGYMGGAAIGARMAVDRGAPLVRAVLMIVVGVSALLLLRVPSLLMRAIGS